MAKVKCQSCGVEIEEWESYGEVCESFCADCISDLIAAEQGYEEWYGVAPHHHCLELTGSIIGSTVIDPLLTERTKDGWYRLGDNTYYWPAEPPFDHEGIYRRYPAGQEPEGAFYIGEREE